jgi:hypothetical protein
MSLQITAVEVKNVVTDELAVDRISDASMGFAKMYLL